MKTKITILIVDDMDFLIEFYKDILIENLIEYELEVLKCLDGGEARNIIKENHSILKLVMTDILHTVISGIELTNIIKETYPSIRVIVTTGLRINEIKNEFKHKPDKLFQKPVNRNEFVDAVRELISD